MIKILRTPAPDFLSSPKVVRTKERLKEDFQNTGRQERLRFDVSFGAIKDDLMEMCHGKCAYCESKLGVTDQGDVENFRPKAGARGLTKDEYAPMHYWWLAYEWENLLLSCQICNQKYKRDFFPLENEKNRCRIGAIKSELLEEGALLIDPTSDDPAEHLEFDKSGLARDLSAQGKATIEILGLNRKELVERRRREADRLLTKLELMISSDFDSLFVTNFLVYIKDLFSDYSTHEYAALQRTIFEEWHKDHYSLWESAKASRKDPSKTKRKKRKTSETSLEVEEVEAIPEKLTVKSTMSRLWEFTKSLLTDLLETIKSVKKETPEKSLQVNIETIREKLTTIKRFSIKNIVIKNFKSIEHLSLDLEPPQPGQNRESWLLLLGDNGIGKSSILQAIALALSTREQLAKLELSVLSILRKGADEGEITIQGYEHDSPITLYFDKNGFKTDLIEPPTFVLAYGATRLLPKGNIKPSSNNEPYLNIDNLFDYSTALNNPNLWLSSVNSSEFDERVAPAFFDVLALREKDKLWIDNGKISIRQFGEDYSLENNSDGYKTITALVSDMMQTLSIDKASYHNSQGIVLIDEIGNHLHPRWRMKIVGALRNAFPNLQFIVTTHEPLCLRGLSHGEVVVMIRDEANNIRTLDKSLLPDHNLLRIDQLLTSDLFGLINVMDEETEKSYEDYYSLLSKPEAERSPDDEKKIREYSSILSEHESLGSTPAMQAIFKLVNENYAKNILAEGFKTREILKEETVAAVKDILSKKKDLDWL